MNLDEIKLTLGVSVLNLKQSEDESGQFTDWFKSWNNATRTRIIAHRDVCNVLGSSSNLEVRTSNRVGPKGSYVEHLLIETKPFEGEVLIF